MEDANLLQNNDESVPGKNVPVTFVKRGFTNVEGNEEYKEELRVYYLQERKSGRTDIKQIFRDFRTNLKIYKKVWFNPYPNLLSVWFRTWEQSLPLTMRKVPIKGRDTVEAKKNEVQHIKEIAYHDLEDGAKNLQSLLIEDAKGLMNESNMDFEVIDANGGLWDKEAYEKIRLKKKEVALAIAKEVLAGVHKHELVKIKKNKEGRETAGFLMDLMKSATAGELTDADLELLETGVPAM